MVFFLAIHIMALLFWCAALLYLPALILVNQAESRAITPPSGRGSAARFVFTNIASPAALLAITAGTFVFLIDYTVEFWLMVKLALVSGLVIMHALMGLLLLRIDTQPEKPFILRCWLSMGIFLLLMGAIIWIVLAKPGPEVFDAV